MLLVGLPNLTVSRTRLWITYGVKNNLEKDLGEKANI
jgi:hypothetical protein